MRRALALAAVLLAIALALTISHELAAPPPEAATDEAPRETGAPPSSSTTTPPVPSFLTPDAPISPPPRSPPLERAATADDGVLEVRATSNGVSLAGAEVTIYSRGARDSTDGAIAWRRAGAGVTRDDGIVRFFAAPGRYVVAARAQRFAPAYKEAVRNAGDAETRVTIALATGVVVRGETVRDEDSARVAFAHVTATPVAETPSGDGDVPRDKEVKTKSDAHGVFSFTNLAPGSYRFSAYAEGEGRGRARESIPRDALIRIALKAPGFLTGTVRAADGSPAAGATVTAYGPATPQTAIAGKNGGFAIEAAPGRHRLVAALAGETGAHPNTVTAIANRTLSGLDIELGRAAAIAGTVTDAKTSQAIAGAVIEVSPFGWYGDSGHGKSGDGGAFTVTPLSPGAYDVVVRAGGYAQKMRRGISVQHGERFELSFALDQPGSIEGIVTDENEAPQAGVLVEPDGKNELQATTNEQGQFHFDEVAPSNVSLRAHRPNEESDVRKRVAVRPGETARVTITLPTSGRLEVEVVDREGKPATGAQLSIEPATKDVSRFKRELDGSASYSFTLVSGAYRAVVRPTPKSDLSGKSAPIRLEPAKTATAKVIVDASGDDLVSGTVLDVDGTPAAQATVIFENSDQKRNGADAWQRTGSDGHFALRRNAAARSSTMQLRAWLDPGKNTPAIPFVAGQEHVLRLLPPGTVEGSVTGVPDGQTIEVELQSSQMTRRLEFAGAAFSFHDVPAIGDATVHVVTSGGRKGEARVRVVSGATATVRVSLE
ncbi:MAG: carboxypeptidase regulatory-like domain-containing protein [Deltaproteobacteria bacterium]|nr:carboxypeptidase regulatory-like domain-containing protein [Deltaproteobacteria bacterium]